MNFWQGFFWRVSIVFILQMEWTMRQKERALNSNSRLFFQKQDIFSHWLDSEYGTITKVYESSVWSTGACLFWTDSRGSEVSTTPCPGKLAWTSKMMFRNMIFFFENGDFGMSMLAFWVCMYTFSCVQLIHLKLSFNNWCKLTDLSVTCTMILPTGGRFVSKTKNAMLQDVLEPGDYFFN